MTDLATAYATTGEAVRAATAVVAVGAGTHAGIGGRVEDATEVPAPIGVLDVQPADMTVTVRAGTSCAELAAALRAVGQECPLDPRDPGATVGGTLAVGLSGRRRLGAGPLRETVLEVVLVRADGRVVRGGGPTVKNVTGYDVPRLMVGSLGTLGVLVQVTLRGAADPAGVRVVRVGPRAVRAARPPVRTGRGHHGSLRHPGLARRPSRRSPGPGRPRRADTVDGTGRAGRATPGPDQRPSGSRRRARPAR